MSRTARPPARSLPAPGGPRRGDREGGLINLTLLMLAVFGTLVVVISVMYVSVASSAAQSNQNAADAAALAGAEAFETAGMTYFAPGFSSAAELRGMVDVSGACPTQVRAAAADYASKNRATLTSCRMVEWGEVEVTTRKDIPVRDAPDARTRARASWSLDWGSCLVDPSFVAPTTGAGFTWMDCAGERFTLKYAANRFFLHPWGQVKDAIDREVHLVD